jgi:hypothetical protein
MNLNWAGFREIQEVVISGSTASRALQARLEKGGGDESVHSVVATKRTLTVTRLRVRLDSPTGGGFTLQMRN